MEELAERQRLLGADVERLITNFKKDPKDRKEDPNYFQKRITTLRSLMDEIEHNDKKIRNLEDVDDTHQYFTNRYFEGVMELGERYIELFQNQWQSLHPPNADAALATLHQDTLHQDAQHQDNHTQGTDPTLMKTIRNQKALVRALKRNVEEVKAEASRNHPASYYELKLKLLEKYLKELAVNNNAIWEKTDLDNVEGYSIEDYYELENVVQNELINLNQRIKDQEAATAAASRTTAVPQETGGNTLQKLVLPKIQLPVFSGDYLKWTEFRDIFMQLIHDQAINPAQKMFYLSSYLAEEPKNLIKHLLVSGTNYAVAWEILCSRYNNQRIMVTTLLNKFMAQASMVTESASSLKALHDTTKECYYGLAAQGLPVTEWDAILTHIVRGKLDKATHTAFEQSLDDNKRLITLDELLHFLESRFQAYETVNSGQAKHINKNTVRHTAAIATTEVKPGCFACKGNHQLFSCPRFLQQTVKERYDLVKQNKLCLNCLKPGHMASQCTSRSCTICHNKHNTLLHRGATQSSAGVSTSPTAGTSLPSKGNSQDTSQPRGASSQGSASTALASALENKTDYVLLGTARVAILNNAGIPTECRALLDSGSQLNLITERMVNRLGLRSSRSEMHIEGIGKGNREASKRVLLNIHSRFNNFQAVVEAYVLPQIVSNQPARSIATTRWNIPENIPLADPDFCNSDKVDVLLGAELHHQLLINGQIKLSDELPILQSTNFGWVIAGKIRQLSDAPATCGVCTQVNLEESIERLWKLEEIRTKEKPLSRLESQCEAYFNQSTYNNTEGRFVVRLPFLTTTAELGDSQQMALNRFLALERRLAKDENLRKQYVEFMTQYENLGHMTEVNISKEVSSVYFIPHHCVLKPESTSTKLRVVFDASAKTTSGWSLNDLMHTGPTVQSDLFSVLLRFRLPKFVFKTDVEKMYRQILVHPEDRKFQMIFWRDSPNEPLRQYELNTVTYGTRAAPYLATKCLRVIADRERDNQPLASQAIKDSFYVDDCLHGSDSLEIALETQNQLIKTLSEAGLKLRKWTANTPELLEGIPSTDQEIDLNLDGSPGITQTLGITWSPKRDELHIKVNLQQHKHVTKRTTTSDLARIYDPLGLLAPVTVAAKMFIQELWNLKVDWDSHLPPEIASRWIEFRKKLPTLNYLQISRHVFSGEIVKSFQLHIFTDASEKAYGAVAYLRGTLKNGKVLVRVLCAKSRVAPTKIVTLPRLELCAAVMGAELASRVTTDLALDQHQTFLWTDSQIVLSWINTSVTRFHTFVANRISIIQQMSSSLQWRHVVSKQNPADILSRGLSPERLQGTMMWFYGPLFLQETEDHWPPSFTTPLQTTSPDDIELKKESRLSSLVATESKEQPHLWLYDIRYNNSFGHLQRIVAYMIRFIDNTRNNKNEHLSKFLGPSDLDASLQLIVRTIQQEDFKDDLKHLRKTGRVNKTSFLASLAPFIDDHDIIRVGGRLKSTDLPYDTKHPMLLPYNNFIVKLLLDELHRKAMHCGPQALLAQARQRFWPIKGKLMTRSIVQHCVRCVHARPSMYQQIMGNLPAARTLPCRPFINSGVDFCGPFKVHYKIRGKRPHKAYVAVYCCFSTKAVHLELVSDLTTDAFIGSLQRFIARRGYCKQLYCDNATNFVGANNKLSELMDPIYASKSKEKITKTCTDKGIQFNFIPPRAPHFGGLWEAAVKAAKSLLVRTTESSSLTYEELETVIIQIEAILNSRPLTPMSNDPNDLTALTPGHFLIGEPLTARVDLHAEPSTSNLTAKWDQLTKIKCNFWNRWKLEYLTELQCRNKWKSSNPNVKEGTLVIVKDLNAPVRHWPLGRIVKTYKGDDGIVRVVDVKMESGIFRRAITSLAPLFPRSESCTIQDEPHSSAHKFMGLSRPANEGNSPERNSTDPSRTELMKSHDSPPQDSEDSHETPPKRTRAGVRVSLPILFMTMILLPMSLGKSINVTNFQNDVGIFFEAIGQAKMAGDDWKIIVYYDIRPFWSEMDAFCEGINTINQLCPKWAQASACESLVTHFEHTKGALLNDQILASTRRPKRAAMDIVGNLAHALFGVLDSQYADEMSSTIEQLKEADDHMLRLARNQTSIIDSTLNILKRDEQKIQARILGIQQQLSDYANSVKTSFNQLRMTQLSFSLATELTMMASNLQYTQSAILDVLTDTHHGKISPMLLSPQQLREEIQKIKSHLPVKRALPFADDNLMQFYKLMTVKAAIKNHHIMFLLELPLVDKQTFTLFKLTPIPVVINATMVAVDTTVKYLASNSQQDEYIAFGNEEFKKCLLMEDDIYICTNQHIRLSQESTSYTCEIQLFNNILSKASCKLLQISSTCVFRQLHNLNQWVYATRVNTTISASCNDELSQFTLHGSGLISLQPNCLIKTNEITLQGHFSGSSNTSMSFPRFGNILNIASFKEIKATFNATSSLDLQLEAISSLQQRLKEESFEFHPTSRNQPNQTIVSYTALGVSIILLLFVIWKTATCQRNVFNIKPAPPLESRQQDSDFKITTT